jgi:DNA-binding MarR family transcriptional regulator
MRSDNPGLRYEALIGLLRASEAIWNASRIFFARWDLGPSQFNILKLLHGVPEGCTQIELSRALLVHRSNVTGLLHRLERRGIIARRGSAEDRRAYRVTLTAAGRRLLRRILPHYHRAAAQMWGDLSDRRIQQMVADLGQVGRIAGQSAQS